MGKLNDMWFGRTVIIVFVGVHASAAHAWMASSAYRLSVAIQKAPAGCGDEHSAPDLYAVVSRFDPELEDRIGVVERTSQQLVSSISMQHVQWSLDDLAERELNSSADPLSDVELRSLASLREAKRAYREARRRLLLRGDTEQALLDFPDDEQLKALEAREPLSSAESQVLRRGRELLNRWHRLRRQLRMRTSPRNPATLRVYPNDELHVVLWEADFFADDRCFSTVVTVGPAALNEGFLDIEETSVRGGRAVQRVLMTLRFAPVR